MPFACLLNSLIFLFIYLFPQHSLRRSSVSYHVKMGAPPTFTPFSSSNVLAALWPRQDDPIAQLDQNDIGASVPFIPENLV